MATKIEAWVQYDVDRNKFDHADDGGEVIYLQKHKEITFDKRATLIIHDGPPERVYTESELEAERKSNRELLQTLADALFKADQYMTSTGDRIGPGCLCHCPVIDGHTGSCPIPPAMRLAASKGITPTHD